MTLGTDPTAWCLGVLFLDVSMHATLVSNCPLLIKGPIGFHHTVPSFFPPVSWATSCFSRGFLFCDLPLKFKNYPGLHFRHFWLFLVIWFITVVQYSPSYLSSYLLLTFKPIPPTKHSHLSFSKLSSRLLWQTQYYLLLWLLRQTPYYLLLQSVPPLAFHFS